MGRGTEVKGKARGVGHLLVDSQGKHLVAPLFLRPGLPVSLVLLLRHLSLLGDAINIRRSLDHALKDCRRRGLAASCISHRNTAQSSKAQMCDLLIATCPSFSRPDLVSVE